MSQLTVQTATIIPFAKHLSATSAGFAVAYTYQPAGQLGIDRGNLLAVIEVLGSTVAAEETIDTIMQTLSDSYFAPGGSATVHERFSQAIREANQALEEEAGGSNKNQGWESRINAVVGILVNDELYVSQTGSAHAYLIRGQRSSKITRELSGHLDGLFAEIATGMLAVGDKLAFVSPALLHQLAEEELIEVVADNVPTTAISRISELLKGQTNLERVAAMIAAVTTPELLAQQVRDQEVDRIEVGKPTSRLTRARGGGVATDNDLSTRTRRAIKRGRKASKSLYDTRLRGKGAGTWGRIKRNWRNPKVLIGAAALAAVLIGGGLWASANSQSAAARKQVAQDYRTALSNYQAAVSATDNATAQAKLTAANQALDSAEHDPAAGQLTAALKQTGGLPQPASFKELRKLIAAESDKRAGLEHRSVTQLRSLPSVKDSSYLLASLNGRLYAVATKGGAINGYNPDAKQNLPDSTPPKELGTVVAIAPGSGGDIIYLLTSGPSVWSYTPANNTYSQIEVSAGTWPAAAAISSYNSNLYLISDNKVTKQVPTLAGYSVPATSVELADTPATGAATLYVDGSMYLGGNGKTITRYTAGKLSGQVKDLPSALAKPLQFITSDTSLFSLDSSGRIGIFATTDTAITVSKQLLLDGSGNPSGIAYDVAKNVLYAVRNNQLVRVNSAN